MSILQEVLVWTKGISAWQSDAIARLLAKQNLEPEDVDDLYALLKTAHGIADEKGRIAKPLEADQIPAPAKPSTQVTLLAVKNLVNVNAIAENVRIPIAPSGLTIVYGDNGSGKSGYSRVLKRACRARDQTEPILPNANFPTGKAGQPQAVFEISVDGKAEDVTWIMGKPAPTALSSLSIFDSRCARAYLDNEDDFSYVPYGLDVFEGLAKLCKELKTRVENEQIQFAVDLTAFAPLHGETEVGKIVRTLSAKTDPAVVTKLATVSDDEHAQHAEIEKGLKENNPKEKATLLRATSKRITVISTNAETQASALSKDAVLKLKELADRYRTAKEAADLAAKQFKEGDALLPGTGGEAWRALFEAAQKFSVESHPGHVFPNLGEESQCPLCQQPLSDKQTSMLQRDFNEFYEALFVISRLDATTVIHLESAAQRICESTVHNALSRWESLHFVERAMKEVLDTLGVRTSGSQGHDIAGNLHVHWINAGKRPLPQALLNDVQCSAAIRYERSPVPFISTLKAHHSSIRLAALVASEIPAVSEMKDTLTLSHRGLARNASLEIARAIPALKKLMEPIERTELIRD